MKKINTSDRLEGLPSIEDVKRWFQLFMGFDDNGQKMREDMKATFFKECTGADDLEWNELNKVGVFKREQLNPDFLKITDGIENRLMEPKIERWFIKLVNDIYHKYSIPHSIGDIKVKNEGCYTTIIFDIMHKSDTSVEPIKGNKITINSETETIVFDTDEGIKGSTLKDMIIIAINEKMFGL